MCISNTPDKVGDKMEWELLTVYNNNSNRWDALDILQCGCLNYNCYNVKKR